MARCATSDKIMSPLPPSLAATSILIFVCKFVYCGLNVGGISAISVFPPNVREQILLDWVKIL